MGTSPRPPEVNAVTLTWEQGTSVLVRNSTEGSESCEQADIGRTDLGDPRAGRASRVPPRRFLRTRRCWLHARPTRQPVAAGHWTTPWWRCREAARGDS